MDSEKKNKYPNAPWDGNIYQAISPWMDRHFSPNLM